MRYIFIIVVMAFACGCASFGVECSSRIRDSSVHYRVIRPAWGVSAKQVDNLAVFKAKLCSEH